VVHAYMSHHHGMLLAALGNHLGPRPLVRRFQQNRAMASMEPYLMERIPWRRSVEKRWVGEGYLPLSGREREGFTAWSPNLDRSPPPVHLLSNGRLSLQLGARGRGGSSWRGWRLRRGGIGKGVAEGSPVLTLMDRDSGAIWDPLPEPGGKGDAGRATFAPHRAEFTRLREGVRARMTVTLPPRTDVEIRDFRLVNEGRSLRRLRLLLWEDVMLAPEGDEERHPAFHRLFVRADRLPSDLGILLERRPRTPEERPPVLGATLVVPEALRSSVRWVVSREALLGRLGRADRARILTDPPASVVPANLPFHPLDPAVGVLVDLQLAPFEEVELSLLVMVAESREALEAGLPPLLSPARRRWLSVQARSRAEGELLALGALPAELPLWEQLLAHVLHPANPDRIHVNPLDPSPLGMWQLWPWGISGDLPIVLLLARRDGAMDLVDSTLRALAWWRGRGVRVDVVIVDEAAGGYEDPVGDRVRARVSELGRFALGDKGGAHLLASDALSPEMHTFLRRMAAVVLDSAEGGLEAQVSRWRAEAAARHETETMAGWESGDVSLDASGIDVFPPEATSRRPVPLLVPGPLQVPSPWGGFSPDGRTYEIRLPAGEKTPAPWANVVAGPALGFLVTESGGGFTWAGDAGEFRLTPWSNDPLLDPSGERVLLTDLDSGRSWSPSPGPAGRARDHRVEHTWGASRLTAEADGLAEELTWVLHADPPAKGMTLVLRNSGARSRRIQVTLEVTWVLGPNPSACARHLLLVWDPARQAVLARNPHLPPHDARIAFLLGSLPPRRAEVDPARNRTRLHYVFRLHPDASVCLPWFMGAVEDASALDSSLDAIRAWEPPAPRTSVAWITPGPEWIDTLTRVHLETPESGLDLLMNGWLAYQTRSSRMLGRTGFYQSGGAFGFRDQLQDAFTLLPLRDDWARTQLVEAARHQFEEGDVLHWWHPGSRRGVRTRCSDDLLWLPFVLAGTALWTGDLSILELEAPFLTSPPLPEGTFERYDLFPESAEVATLWGHGRRALDLAWTRRSPRGLPLIGTGDWNDGMDRVGEEGRGESLWLGWFFARTLGDWARVARMAGRETEASESEARARELIDALEHEGWDGAWYRRAYFDDGTPIGSSTSIEAQIDSIAQSWAVLAGLGDPARARQALASAWEHLVRLDDGLALLLSPPFDGHGPHPGYIAAYPPGVRENGGQYTHAAAWLVGALARAGEGDRAGALLKAILPTRHGERHGHRYRVEPYVVAADVYGVAPHIGRGGWTWYTGSAGWIFRVVFEEILGVVRRGQVLALNPCIPRAWPGYTLAWQVGGCTVKVRVTNPRGVERGIRRCLRNGTPCPPEEIPIPPEGTLDIDVELG
jgi:cyclic beta-1,2-glucan synthetase